MCLGLCWRLSSLEWIKLFYCVHCFSFPCEDGLGFLWSRILVYILINKCISLKDWLFFLDLSFNE